MQSFKNFITESQRMQLLIEKLIMFGGGAKYGQIVFLAGGAGSGKGFSVANYMNSNDFKIRDVDAYKKALIELGKAKNDPQLSGLNLRNPEDVYKLHTIVKNKGIKNKTLDLLLGDLHGDRLPNIIFDVTMQDMGDLNDLLPRLVNLGYEPRNIHLVWVLANFHIAATRNKKRDRVVPDDIVLLTHAGAAITIYDIIRGNVPPLLDGRIDVVLNDDKLIVYYDQSANARDGAKRVVKDFPVIHVKQAGKRIGIEKDVQNQLFDWITKNIPITDKTLGIFKDISSSR